MFRIFKMLNQLIKCFFIVLTLFFIHPHVLKAEQKEIIVAADSWPPFRMIHKKPYAGIDFDLWEEVSKRLDLKIKFEVYPWSRILRNLRTGKVDAMSGLAKRDERAQYMHYTSVPYYSCSVVFYLKKGEGHLVKEYEDLYKYPIAYVSNSAYFERFDNDTKLNKHGVTAEIQLLKMLNKGHIKIIVGTDCNIDYDISRLGYADKFEKAYYKPKNITDLYFVISKKSPFSKELSKINETIKEIIEEGKVKEFSQKYYNEQ